MNDIDPNAWAALNLPMPPRSYGKLFIVRHDDTWWYVKERPTRTNRNFYYWGDTNGEDTNYLATVVELTEADIWWAPPDAKTSYYEWWPIDRKWTWETVK